MRPARVSPMGSFRWAILVTTPPLEASGIAALEEEMREIADELQISHNTVRTHLRNSMQRVGARSRAHLVAKALGEGHALAP